MTDDGKPGESHLCNAIYAAITDSRLEWDLTQAEIVGCLTIIAAEYAHMCFEHDEDG